MSVELNDQNFNNVINGNKVVMVDLWANWCGPCKGLMPVIDELARDYNGRAVIAKLDIDKNPNVTTQYGVKTVPTLLFFKNGQLVDKAVGVGSKSAIASKINALL